MHRVAVLRLCTDVQLLSIVPTKSFFDFIFSNKKLFVIFFYNCVQRVTCYGVCQHLNVTSYLQVCIFYFNITINDGWNANN